MGTHRNTVGSLFVCALLYNFGVTLPFGGVITGAFCNVSACNAHKVWINTRVMSCVVITLLCNNCFSQKFITHKDLDLLLHSFPSCPAVVCGASCGGLRSAVVCSFQTYPQINNNFPFFSVTLYINCPVWPPGHTGHTGHEA